MANRQLPEPVGDPARRYIDALPAEADASPSVRTGFHMLDELTHGFEPGDLVIVGGRPSMGKTSFCLNVADHATTVDHKAVLWFTLEGTARQLVRTLLCSRARVPLQRVRFGAVTDGERQRLRHAAHDLQHAALFIDEAARTGVSSLLAAAHAVKQEHGLDLVVLDYLQLLDTEPALSRADELARASRQLKLLARELGAPVLVATQLGRHVDAREDRRPRLTDLRDAETLAADADVVCLLYREAVYGETDHPDEAYVFVAKQRRGRTGQVPLRFSAETMRFENPTL